MNQSPKLRKGGVFPTVECANWRIPMVITGAVHTPPQPCLVQPLMEEWVRDLASTRLHPIVAAALFHIRFEAIHPFIDGNGRAGRLLANFVLMSSGFLPVSIKYEDRIAYYNAFTAYHSSENIVPMLRIFAEAECTRLQAVSRVADALAAGIDAGLGDSQVSDQFASGFARLVRANLDRLV